MGQCKQEVFSMVDVPQKGNPWGQHSHKLDWMQEHRETASKALVPDSLHALHGHVGPIMAMP